MALHRVRRRFYKAGGLMQYHTHGCVIYQDRSDTTVKLRGQRIELGEASSTYFPAFRRSKLPSSRSLISVLAELKPG